MGAGGKQRSRGGYARQYGQRSRAQKEMLEREIRAREERIAELEARNADALELIESGLASRAAEVLGEGNGNGGSSTRSDLTYVFVTGCARSGTSAMVDLVNSDHRVVLGMERFKYLRGRLRRHHFDPQYFLNPTPDETNLTGRRYEALRRKWSEGTPRVVGDKLRIRNNVEVVIDLIGELGDVRLLYMLRELPGVASSYNKRATKETDVNWREGTDYRKAVDHWNGSLRALRELHDAGYGDRVLVVSYEHLFSGETGQAGRIAGFMGLERSEEIQRGLRRSLRRHPELKRGEDLDPEARAYLDEHADAELYRWARSLVASG
jgi:hypothetical protein